MEKSLKLLDLMKTSSTLNNEQVFSLICRFYDLVLKENEIQNLTRLISPEDFYEGHVNEAIELSQSGFLSQKCLDLGTGMGSPGLFSAIIDSSREWVLLDSEKSKADFVKRAATELGLKNVTVFSLRVEEYLKSHKTETVVSRAVGPVERILKWIGPCSTWNNLVLMKGPSWDEEWKKYDETINEQSGHKRYTTKKINYTTVFSKSQRVLVSLSRVPRGTS